MIRESIIGHIGHALFGVWPNILARRRQRASARLDFRQARCGLRLGGATHRTRMMGPT